MSCTSHLISHSRIDGSIANKELRLCCCIQWYPQVTNISKLDLMPNFSMIEKVTQQECGIDYFVSKYTFLLINQFKYIFVLTICIKKMNGVRSIAMKSIRASILTLLRNRSSAPGTPFPKIFIMHPRNFFLDRNDVEFDFSIGHDLVLFPFL